MALGFLFILFQLRLAPTTTTTIRQQLQLDCNLTVLRKQGQREQINDDRTTTGLQQSDSSK
jgi:hypothetical protein